MKLMTNLARVFRRNDPGTPAPDPSQPGGPSPSPDANWVPTHRHRKGGLYRVVGHGILEADRTQAVIYDDAEGTVWIRSAAEFADGRFESLGPETDTAL
ncbi:DUF1653 domain-containing protein [uncultured Roseobacter sp.]|uniref:DUF1653 domain-containing protein n=1 Tax=uncultured Roseobacter sp. TaxID=114847 RepID=UPI00261811E4|nr:DUF1653 domain-containing protein [uncultured Roseobacter sp.]